jgi:hypothetical protein
MTMHSMKGRTLTHNIWAQLGLLAAATVILLVLASSGNSRSRPPLLAARLSRHAGSRSGATPGGQND